MKRRNFYDRYIEDKSWISFGFLSFLTWFSACCKYNMTCSNVARSLWNVNWAANASESHKNRVRDLKRVKFSFYTKKIENEFIEKNQEEISNKCRIDTLILFSKRRPHSTIEL
jgi:hypothetical protein